MVKAMDVPFIACLLSTIEFAMKFDLVATSMSYISAPEVVHVYVGFNAISFALLPGRASVGARAAMVVKLQTDDQLLLVEALFACTLQKYFVPAVNPDKLIDVDDTIALAETTVENVESVETSTE